MKKAVVKDGVTVLVGLRVKRYADTHVCIPYKFSLDNFDHVAKFFRITKAQQTENMYTDFVKF